METHTFYIFCHAYALWTRVDQIFTLMVTKIQLLHSFEDRSESWSLCQLKFNHTSIPIPIKMKKHITSLSRKQQHFHNLIPFNMFPPIKNNIILMIMCVCMPSIQKVQELLLCIENAFFQNLEWKKSLLCLQMQCVLILMLKFSHYTQVQKLKS